MEKIKSQIKVCAKLLWTPADSSEIGEVKRNKTSCKKELFSGGFSFFLVKYADNSQGHPDHLRDPYLCIKKCLRVKVSHRGNSLCVYVNVADWCTCVCGSRGTYFSLAHSAFLKSFLRNLCQTRACGFNGIYVFKLNGQYQRGSAIKHFHR